MNCVLAPYTISDIDAFVIFSWSLLFRNIFSGGKKVNTQIVNISGWFCSVQTKFTYQCESVPCFWAAGSSMITGRKYWKNLYSIFFCDNIQIFFVDSRTD